MIFCPHCGKEHPDDTRFCPETGRRLSTKVCSNPVCSFRKPLPADAYFCPACGTPLNGDGSTRSPLPVPFIADRKATHIDMSVYDTSAVTDMCAMFTFCEELESLNLQGMNTAAATDMSLMFISCKKLKTLDLSSFNTSRVTDMCSMFRSCNHLEIGRAHV